MFPMGSGDVMNFGSVSPQGTDSYIPLPPDQVENSLLSPLQNRVSGHMGPQHVPMGHIRPKLAHLDLIKLFGVNLPCSGELMVL